jgi:GT2 family glycosyltransferase
VVRQTVPVAEVIIAHCGADAETCRVAEDRTWRDRGLECRYVRVPSCNAAEQRNLAIATAQHDNLLLMDDDVELNPDWAAELFRPIWSDDRVGATMGQVIGQQWPTPTFWWRLYRRLLPGVNDALKPGRLIPAILANGFPREAAAPVPAEWLGGGLSAIRRQAFESVGGFADYFSGPSPGEDLDLGYRLSRHWKVLYVPTARCLHHQEPSGRTATAEYQFQSIRSRFAIMRRAMGKSRAVAIAHILYWMLFQMVAEIAALRHQPRPAALVVAWWGRMRGVASCLSWEPPPNIDNPSLFPVPE